MLRGKHKEVEALFLWHEHLRGKGLPVTGPMLQEKALKCKLEIVEGEETEFTASDGWLDRWIGGKKRFGVRQLTINGEALSAKTDAAPIFKDYLGSLIEKEGITGDQLYNCDETGLDYKIPPIKNPRIKAGECCPGIQKKQGAGNGAGLWQCYRKPQAQTNVDWKV